MGTSLITDDPAILSIMYKVNTNFIQPSFHRVLYAFFKRLYVWLVKKKYLWCLLWIIFLPKNNKISYEVKYLCIGKVELVNVYAVYSLCQIISQVVELKPENILTLNKPFTELILTLNAIFKKKWSFYYFINQSIYTQKTFSTIHGNKTFL